MKRLITVLLVFLPLATAHATSVEQRGLEIAKEMDQRDLGFADQVAELVMILRNKQNDQSVRKIRNRTLEVQGDGDKSLVIFDSPADVKGTAFLSYTHAVKPDDQWLYLPALKRVKRISSSNKSGPFMGSEFAYEDLTSQEVEKYKYKYIGDEKLDGRDVFVIERYPQYSKSGYSKQVVWVDKAYYQPLKTKFYDRKNSLLKTLTITGYKQYLNKYWRPSKMMMINHQTGKQTELTWSHYRFRTGLTSRDFDRNALKRVQ